MKIFKKCVLCLCKRSSVDTLLAVPLPYLLVVIVAVNLFGGDNKTWKIGMMIAAGIVAWIPLFLAAWAFESRYITRIKEFAEPYSEIPLQGFLMVVREGRVVDYGPVVWERDQGVYPCWVPTGRVEFKLNYDLYEVERVTIAFSFQLFLEHQAGSQFLQELYDWLIGPRGDVCRSFVGRFREDFQEEFGKQLKVLNAWQEYCQYHSLEVFAAKVRLALEKLKLEDICPLSGAHLGLRFDVTSEALRGRAYVA